MQAFTFYASDDKLDNRGNAANTKYTGAAINKRAAELAKKVADEGGALTLGGICQCPTYLSGAGKEILDKEWRKSIERFDFSWKWAIWTENFWNFATFEECFFFHIFMDKTNMYKIRNSLHFSIDNYKSLLT